MPNFVGPQFLAKFFSTVLIRERITTARFLKENFMSNPTLTNVRNELKPLMHDAQDLLDKAAEVGEAGAAELRSKAMQVLDHAITRANDLQESAVRKGRKIAHDTDVYVHEKPWHAVAVAGAVGLLIGMLIIRR